MQPLLFLLVFGQICFSASQNPVYHFISESMSWAEAQTYCRQYYTDLATVRNMKELKRLTAAADGRTDAWIGLHQTTDEPEERKWHWSQPEVKYNETEVKWSEGQPTDMGQDLSSEGDGGDGQNCIVINKWGKWTDANCHKPHSFICYNESSNTSVLISESKRKWLEAQEFCRTHHTDLMSGLDQQRQTEVKYLNRPDKCWIGLFRDNWGWSDGSNSSFRNFKTSVNAGANKCATLSAQSRWESADCGEEKHFVCHDGQTPQNLTYHFISESKSWAEAQTYCRQNYTDLATVRNMKELKRLTAAADGRTDVWIGLHQGSGDPKKRKWHWSQPEVKHNEGEAEWDTPDERITVRENCVAIGADGRWFDTSCLLQCTCFICYNESSNTSVLISESKTWLEAQEFCRTHHTDLMSGLDQQRQTEVKYLNRPDKCWIGLSRDNWGWSDGSDSSFRNVETSVNPEPKKCATLRAQGRWASADCDHNKSFICHDDLFILVKEKKTWEEALIYCRTQHRDLAWFIDKTHLKKMAVERAKMADNGTVWVGLHYICFLEAWAWVNGHYVSYMNENWEDHGGNKCSVGGAMQGDKWVKRDLGEKYNFICVTKRK